MRLARRRDHRRGLVRKSYGAVVLWLDMVPCIDSTAGYWRAPSFN